LLLTILLFLIIENNFSQEDRMVCGRLKDKSDEPLPGVCVIIKGTTIGAISDINGNYCIKVPLGSTLVYSFVGFVNNEVLVTLRNSQPITNFTSQNGKVEVKSSYTPIYQNNTNPSDTLSDTVITAYFTPATPSYEIVNPNYNWFSSNKTDASKIKNIEYSFNKTKISLIKDEYLKLPHITFLSSFSVETYTNSPKLQTEYAQGRPFNGTLQWQGPELNEIFSWGPAIRNLEYDGSGYDFDKNGRIVLRGFGNGTNVRTYNPLNFFKTGTTFYNYIKIHEKQDKKEYSITASYKNKHGIMPNSFQKGYYFDANLTRIFQWIKLSSHFTYDISNSSFMSGALATNLIMTSILSTPPTFDNGNGLSGNSALNNKESYLQLNNMQRSYATGLANNPYWLVNNLSDKEKQAVTNISFNTDIKISKQFHHFIEGTIQNQDNNTNLKYPENTAGIDRPRELSRTDKLTSYMVTTGLKFDCQDNRNITINSLLSYQNKYAQRILKRKDYFIANDSLQTFNNSPFYKLNEIVWNTNFSFFERFLGKISQNLTNSNIYTKKILYSPSFSAGINFHNFWGYNDFIDFLKLRGYWGINYSDLPLAYSFGNFDVMRSNSARHQNAFFDFETIINPDLNPEKIIKKGLGIDLNLLQNRINICFDVYQNKTYQAIFPILETNSPILKNLADYKTWGMDADLNFFSYSYYSKIHTNFKLIFSYYRNEVTNIANNLSEIPLAGFSDIHTALVKGQPKGILVGTSYQYNEKGEMIIGDDGFPLKDNTLHVIGNPNPDFVLGFETNLSYKSFSFSMLTEFRKGGEVWNGTENALAYLGLAEKTIDERKITGYIFSGVKTDGTPNSKQVDFGNSTNPIETNLWYRYGPTGVAEDAIQDATCFRIREITISYNNKHHKIQYNFSVFIRNPLLISKYKGVDPESTLWGKANTMGLDLFNFPNTTSIGINFKLSL